MYSTINFPNCTLLLRIDVPLGIYVVIIDFVKSQ